MGFKVNKENMIIMLQDQIEHELVTKALPFEVEHDEWKDGYITALKNILFAISMNGC